MPQTQKANKRFTPGVRKKDVSDRLSESSTHKLSAGRWGGVGWGGCGAVTRPIGFSQIMVKYPRIAPQSWHNYFTMDAGFPDIA